MVRHWTRKTTFAALAVVAGAHAWRPPRRPATMIGTQAGERLIGTGGADTIMAAAGNDRVRGLGGDDVVYAGRGQRSSCCGGDGQRLRPAAGPAATGCYGGNGNDQRSRRRGRNS